MACIVSFRSVLILVSWQFFEGSVGSGSQCLLEEKDYLFGYGSLLSTIITVIMEKGSSDFC